MKDKITFFLPMRKGSERVKCKNTRPFADVHDGLVANKLMQVTRSKLIDEILVSTNDEMCINVARKFGDSRLRVLERPEPLCSSQTNLQDLICYVPTITDAEHIVWGHVTTPIAGAEDYDQGIECYLKMLQKGYDSLIGVKELHNFLLNKDGRIINNTSDLPWPRTQDLETLYEVNHTMFIAGRRIYEQDRNRIGKHPYLYVMDEMVSFDIDWEEDFKIAELIYMSMKRNNQVGGGGECINYY